MTNIIIEDESMRTGEIIYHKIINGKTLDIVEEDGGILYIISDNIEPCIECSSLTNKIDVYTGERLCTKECSDRFYASLINDDQYEGIHNIE